VYLAGFSSVKPITVVGSTEDFSMSSVRNHARHFLTTLNSEPFERIGRSGPLRHYKFGCVAGFAEVIEREAILVAEA